MQNIQKNHMVENNDRHLIVFNNGTYDLKIHEFKENVFSDSMNASVGYDYKANHSNSYNELLQFLEDILPNENEREFMLTYLSIALCENILKWITSFVGTGNNGKSALLQLIRTTFGDYYGVVPDQLSALSELTHMQNKKLITSHDFNFGDKLNTNFIKFVTEQKFVTLLETNAVLDLDQFDPLVSARLRCIVFSTVFCNNPVRPNEKKSNANICDKFDEWKADFMLLLLEHNKKYMETKEIKITETNLMWENQYINQHKN